MHQHDKTHSDDDDHDHDGGVVQSACGKCVSDAKSLERYSSLYSRHPLLKPVSFKKRS